MLFTLFFSTVLATSWNQHSTSTPRSDAVWKDVPDRDAIDSRCSLTGINLVESVQGDQWLPHFACPHGTTCFDLHGKGACKAGEYEYGVPGLNYLWLFHCSNFYDPGTCHFPDPAISHQIKWDQEPYGANHTRCSTNRRVVEHRIGQEWADLYACKPDATCIEAGDRAVCEHESNLTHLQRARYLSTALTSNKPVDIRCNPESRTEIQYFNNYIGWTMFHGCMYECTTIAGKPACKHENGLYFPTITESPKRKHKAGQSKRNALAHPHLRQDRISKCDGPTSPGISSFVEGHLIARSNCPRDMSCRNVNNRAVCAEADRYYIMDHEEHMLRRDETDFSDSPEIHVFDTRCNPSDLSEIQRFNHTIGRWVHHSTCTLKSACLESQGHGACHLLGAIY